MTADEPMTQQERTLRERLQAGLVPPSTPDRLLLTLDAIADHAVRAERPRRRLLDHAPSFGRPGLAGRLRVGLAVVAAIVIVAGALTLGSSFWGQQGVAATPFPALPSAAPHPLPMINQGAWVSPDVAWVEASDDQLYLTDDGGMTWSGPRPLPAMYLREIGFRDASNGWAVFAPQQVEQAPVDVYLTHDGGRSWSKTTVGTISSAVDGHMVGLTLHFSDAEHGVVLAGDYVSLAGGGGMGIVPMTCLGWTTGDGGATWRQLTDAPCALHDWWATPQVGVLLSVETGGPETWLTTDGGETWTKGRLPADMTSAPEVLVFTLAADGTPRLVTAPGGGTADPITTHAGSALETRDGGRTWAVAHDVAPPEDHGAASSGGSAAAGPDDWLITWMRGGVAPATLYETQDAGRTWREVTTLPNGLQGLRWLDRLHAIGGGLDDSGCSRPDATPCHVPTLLLTNDGGETWHGLPIEDPLFPARPTASPAATPTATPTAMPFDSEQAALIARGYGETVPNEYGGVYLDQSTGHVVVLFTANLEQHRQAILDKIGASVPLEVRQAKYTMVKLLALQERISSDMGSKQPAWLKAIPAMLIGSGPDEMHNWLAIEASSANPDAPALILAHYDVPAGMLHVSSDGTGVALMPRGWVDVSVSVPASVTVPPGGSWDIEMVPDGPGLWGGGDIGYGVEPGKSAAVPATEGGWTVRLIACCDATVVGTGHVTVMAGGHVPLVVTVR